MNLPLFLIVPWLKCIYNASFKSMGKKTYRIGQNELKRSVDLSIWDLKVGIWFQVPTLPGDAQDKSVIANTIGLVWREMSV